MRIKIYLSRFPMPTVYAEISGIPSKDQSNKLGKKIRQKDPNAKSYHTEPADDGFNLVVSYPVEKQGASGYYKDVVNTHMVRRNLKKIRKKESNTKKLVLRKLIDEEIQFLLGEQFEPKKGQVVNIINYDLRKNFKGKVQSIDKFGYNIIGLTGIYKGKSITLKPSQWDGSDFEITSRGSRM